MVSKVTNSLVQSLSLYIKTVDITLDDELKDNIVKRLEYVLDEKVKQEALYQLKQQAKLKKKPVKTENGCQSIKRSEYYDFLRLKLEEFKEPLHEHCSLSYREKLKIISVQWKQK
jgi:hypothetical protein